MMHDHTGRYGLRDLAVHCAPVICIMIIHQGGFDGRATLESLGWDGKSSPAAAVQQTRPLFAADAVERLVKGFADAEIVMSRLKNEVLLP